MSATRKRIKPYAHKAKAFGKWLRRKRLGMAVGVVELATKTDLDPGSICHYESGVTTPPFATAERLGIALGCKYECMIRAGYVPPDLESKLLLFLESMAS